MSHRGGYRPGLGAHPSAQIKYVFICMIALPLSKRSFKSYAGLSTMQPAGTLDVRLYG